MMIRVVDIMGIDVGQVACIIYIYISDDIQFMIADVCICVCVLSVYACVNMCAYWYGHWSLQVVPLLLSSHQCDSINCS